MLQFLFILDLNGHSENSSLNEERDGIKISVLTVNCEVLEGTEEGDSVWLVHVIEEYITNLTKGKKNIRQK